MTSIFNTYYSHNLNRLNSSADEQTRAKQGEGEKGREFAKVLGDLEKKPATPSVSNTLSEFGREVQAPREQFKPPTPPLTNLHIFEQDAVVEDGAKLLEQAGNQAIPYDEKLLKSVKLGSDTVKFLAPETVSSPLPSTAESLTPDLSAGKPPATPVIREAKRLNGYELQQPGNLPPTPRLAGARRLPGEELPIARTDTGPHDGIKEIIATAGKYYGVDPNLSMAIAQAESSFRPHAVSKDGHESKGIFQLLDSTGKDMRSHTGLDEHYDPFDPAQNTYLGVGYLRRLHDIFSVETNLGGNMRTVPVSSAENLEKLAVAAFNAGEGNVARAQARARSFGKDPTEFSSVEPFLPASTRSYVQKVSQLREQFAAAETGKKLA